MAVAGLSQNQDISQPESAAYQARITVLKCLSIDWASEKHSWLEELRAILDETERAMDFVKLLAVLRSPEGLSSIPMLATNWDAGLRRPGLPSALPPEWLGQSGAEAPAGKG